MSIPLGSLVSPELIFPDLTGGDRDSLLEGLAAVMAKHGVVRNADTLYRRLSEREDLGSTAIGDGIAIPHCKLDRLDRVVVAVGLSQQGVDFEAVDGRPVHLVFLVLSPTEAPAEHLRSLAAISRWAKVNRHAERLMQLRDPKEIYELLRAEAA